MTAWPCSSTKRVRDKNRDKNSATAPIEISMDVFSESGEAHDYRYTNAALATGLLNVFRLTQEKITGRTADPSFLHCSHWTAIDALAMHDVWLHAALRWVGTEGNGIEAQKWDCFVRPFGLQWGFVFAVMPTHRVVWLFERLIISISMPVRNFPTFSPGPMSRRSFLQFGGLSMLGMSLADVLRSQAVAGGATRARDASVIFIWLPGGPPHMETYDMKPEAPSEYRGIFHPIRTNVKGME